MSADWDELVSAETSMPQLLFTVSNNTHLVLRTCPETIERNQRWNMHEVVGGIAGVMYPSDLTDSQWWRLEPLLNEARGDRHAGGRPRK